MQWGASMIVALAQALYRFAEKNIDADTLSVVAIFCGIGLLVSLVAIICGMDFSDALF